MVNERHVDFTDIFVSDAIVDRVEEVLRSTRYVKGPNLEAFEAEFARLCGVEHAIGVSNGTMALLVSMKALDIGPHAEVFLPAHTFFASVSPVLELGADPVFVDVDPSTYTLDIEDLSDKLDRADRPRAIVPVHLYGHPAPMSAVLDLADDHDLTVVEDACQAHGATCEDQPVGSFGDVGCFSFYPSKNMTVAGEGGMIVTDRDDVDETARRLRNHGRDHDGVHRNLGLNYRLGEIQAAVGLEQLPNVVEWGTDRRRAAHLYTERLSDIPAVTPPGEADAIEHVYHLYVIRAEDRDDLRDHLGDRGVETGIHYPVPVHRHPAVVDRIGKPDPVETAEAVCDQILSLPMHPRIGIDEIEYVCDTIRDFYGATGS